MPSWSTSEPPQELPLTPVEPDSTEVEKARRLLSELFCEDGADGPPAQPDQ